MATTVLHRARKLAATSRLYLFDRLPGYWIAEATDNCLYLVHNERGGWRKRVWFPELPGLRRKLKPVSIRSARLIIEYLDGYAGTVRIAA